MKTLPLLACTSLLTLLPHTTAEARDHISIGLGFSTGPTWGPCFPRCYPRYYEPTYAYAPVYVAPQPPVVYYPAPYPAPVSTAQVYQSIPYPPPQWQPAPEGSESRIARVQAALRQRKYYNGYIDGLIGPATQSAIRAYQIDRNLPITGRIDAALLADLGL